MGTIKTKNKFTTLDFDSSQASIDNTSLRKAENISILGDYIIMIVMVSMKAIYFHCLSLSTTKKIKAK